MTAISWRRRRAAPDAVITTAQRGRSHDLASREVRYALTMGVRVACFVAMAFVTGPLRWVLLAGAAFLPGIAVLFANAIDLRSRSTPVVHSPEHRPSLTAEPAGTERLTTIDQD